MKVQDEQTEKILLDAFIAGAKFMKDGNLGFRDWYINNSSRILALGKQKPLAKNKQTQEFCKKCNEKFKGSMYNGLCFKCFSDVYRHL